MAQHDAPFQENDFIEISRDTSKWVERVTVEDNTLVTNYGNAKYILSGVQS